MQTIKARRVFPSIRSTALALSLSGGLGIGIGLPTAQAQSVNPAVSPTGSVLLAPPSRSGPQAFNPSMAPESRVLLAPTPGKERKQTSRAGTSPKRDDIPGFNAAVSPASRVLLAPIPKSTTRRAEAQARERARKVEQASRPGPTTGKSPTTGVSAPRAAAGLPDYEAQLAAIRTELIEAASRAQVRVKSVSWIDTQGQLHEANEFRSDAKVRGIRVNRYLGESRVEVDDLQAASAAEDCMPKASPYKRHAFFSVQADPGGSFFSSAQLAILAESLGPELLAIFAADTGWAFSQSPYSASASKPQSLYEQRLLGRLEDSAPYQLTVRLVDMGRRADTAPSADSESGSGPRLAPPAWLRKVAVDAGITEAPPELGSLGIVLLMSDRQTGTTVFSRSITLPMQQLRTGYLDAPRAVVSDIAQAQRALASLQQGLRTGMGCVAPEYPVLERQPEGRYLLNGGRRLGLTVGGQILLAAPDQVPARILQPEVAASLSLAVVESVEEDRAVVRRVAGPVPSAAAALVGLPF
ncbi:MAG: hypothetical protein RLZZ344_966 [Pseudomonadota bacterium]